MPAVTPADEYVGPSFTKMASGSTEVLGCRRASSRACFQCVVALRSSSSPAEPSTKAPVQTEAIRRVRSASERVASRSSSGTGCDGNTSPPATSTVS